MSPRAPERPARRHQFHDLVVTDREQLTDRAVALSFAVPDELVGEFLRFEAGQHLTLRAQVGGEDVRQSYSLCLSPARARRMQAVRVGVGVVPGGRMSTHLNSVVDVGDSVAVMPALGGFVVPSEPESAKHHVLIAAGSGITPVLSHVETILTAEPQSRVTLFYGNRTTADVMFLEELEGLKDEHLSRFHLVHVLSREPLAVELLSGRMDPPRLERLFEAFAPVSGVDEFYLCGPFGMVEGARGLLGRSGCRGSGYTTRSSTCRPRTNSRIRLRSRRRLPMRSSPSPSTGAPPGSRWPMPQSRSSTRRCGCGPMLPTRAPAVCAAPAAPG